MEDDKKEEVTPEAAPVSEETNANHHSFQRLSTAPFSTAVAKTDAMIEASKVESPLESKKFTIPKLFVKSDELEEIAVEIIFSPETGEVLSISEKGYYDNVFTKALSSVVYKFWFSPVTYEKMQAYRRATSFYDSSLKDFVVNRFQQRSFFLINHFKKTDMLDNDGKPIEIKMDAEKDNLSSETLAELYRTIPTLLEVVMSLFEQKVMFAVRETT